MTRTEPGWVVKPQKSLNQRESPTQPGCNSWYSSVFPTYPSFSFFLLPCFHRTLHNRNPVQGRPEANQVEIMSVNLPFYHINHSCTYHISLRTAQLIMGRQMLTENDNECQTTSNVRFWPEEKWMWFINLMWSQKVGEHFFPTSHPCSAQWFYRPSKPCKFVQFVWGKSELIIFC